MQLVGAMARPKTSFSKVGGSRLPTIDGTWPSAHNFQLLTGTGIPNLDAVFGGGIPVGSVVLIEDNEVVLWRSG